MSKLSPGSQWMREEFTSPPWTKAQLVDLIREGEIPGEVIAGKPFVYAAKVLTWEKPTPDGIPNFMEAG